MHRVFSRKQKKSGGARNPCTKSRQQNYPENPATVAHRDHDSSMSSLIGGRKRLGKLKKNETGCVPAHIRTDAATGIRKNRNGFGRSNASERRTRQPGEDARQGYRVPSSGKGKMQGKDQKSSKKGIWLRNLVEKRSTLRGGREQRRDGGRTSKVTGPF